MLQTTWYRLGRFLVSVLARGGLEVSVHWKAPLPDGPVILAANHPSTIDPALITTLTGEQVSVLILDTLFKVPLFGRSLRYCGHIPVIQGRGGQALAEAEGLLRAGRSVVVFPEGEVSPLDGGFHGPRTGMARLALATGAPVVPVGIHLDSGQLRRIETNVDGESEMGTWYFHGPYAMTVGAALRFSGNVEDRELVRQISGQIMQRIVLLAGESARRVQAGGRADWRTAARWWGVAPWRLVRSWGALSGIKLY